MQVEGLARRFQATSGNHMIIGVSGGLDSTHALIVADKACDRLGLPRSTILGFTMPGFATGETTKFNAWALMKALGIESAEIDIRSEEHTSELQSLMRITYAVFCLKTNTTKHTTI